MTSPNTSNPKKNLPARVATDNTKKTDDEIVDDGWLAAIKTVGKTVGDNHADGYKIMRNSW